MDDSSGHASSMWRNPSLLAKIPKRPIYYLTRTLSKVVISAYFGHIQTIGIERIPCEGPIIFVGNHNNKFVDAFLMMMAIPREISFLIASVSLKIPWIGTFARLLGAIGVERPEDSKFVGMGKVCEIIEIDDILKNPHNHEAVPPHVQAFVSQLFFDGDNSRTKDMWLIKGNEHTRFPIELEPSYKLKITDRVTTVGGDPTAKLKMNGSFNVHEIFDDHYVVAKYTAADVVVTQVEKGLNRLEGVFVWQREGTQSPEKSPLNQRKSTNSRSISDNELAADATTCSAPSAFFIYPKVNQGMVYERVSDVLRHGDCICIFPEGGSHDRPDLLPLKPGVALFALQAFNAGVKDVVIMPVGLHYFERHKLGSNAVVDVGKPVIVQSETVKQFNEGGEAKQQAVNAVLKAVRDGLRSVTVTAETYRTLQAIQRCSEVYIPLRLKSTVELQHRLQGIFTALFNFAGIPPALVELADEYTRTLEARGFSDSDVAEMVRHTCHRNSYGLHHDWSDSGDTLYLYGLLGIKVVSLVICFIVAIPALCMSYPLKRLATKKSLQAAMKSSVKIAGVDVLASTKIEIFLTCIPAVVLLAAFIGALGTSYSPGQLCVLFPFYLIVTSAIVYYGLRLTVRVRRLRKQVHCYYTMCLTQASATELGTNLIAERSHFQALVRDAVQKALDKLQQVSRPGNGHEIDETISKASEAATVLESLCPMVLVVNDAERVRKQSSKNAPLCSMFGSVPFTGSIQVNSFF